MLDAAADYRVGYLESPPLQPGATVIRVDVDTRFQIELAFGCKVCDGAQPGEHPRHRTEPLEQIAAGESHTALPLGRPGGGDRHNVGLGARTHLGLRGQYLHGSRPRLRSISCFA